MLRTYQAYSHDDLLLLLQLPASMLLHPPAIYTPQPSLMIFFTPRKKKKNLFPLSTLPASKNERKIAPTGKVGVALIAASGEGQKKLKTLEEAVTLTTTARQDSQSDSLCRHTTRERRSLPRVFVY
jgi:hypothetical protein